jgi:hypothetical protein
VIAGHDSSCSSFQRGLLVIPAKAGLSTAELVIQLLLNLKVRASTPPAEERVTFFFTRVKKKVTKKEARCLSPRFYVLQICKGAHPPNH